MQTFFSKSLRFLQDILEEASSVVPINSEWTGCFISASFYVSTEDGHTPVLKGKTLVS